MSDDIPRITLVCPTCQRRNRSLKIAGDPEGCTKIVVQCDRCDRGGGLNEASYFDADGNELAPEESDG